MRDEFDTAIVGGGIIGASIAYHLVKAGQKVLLIDADHKGKATKAGAGIISAATTFSEDDNLYQLLLKSSQYYPELAKELEEQNKTSSSYEISEEVLVAFTDDELSKFNKVTKRMLRRQAENNYPEKDELYEIEIDDFKQKFPDLSVPLRAIYYAKAAKVDGKVFMESLVRAAQSLGLELINGMVTSLAIEDNETCVGICLRNATIKAKNTIIAGGAWTKNFEKQLGIELPLFPQRGQIAHLIIKETQKPLPIVITMHDYYSLNWGSARLVIGATREDDTGFVPKNTVKGVQRVLKHGMEMIPGVADAEISDIRVGLRPYSIDKIPIIGPINKYKRLWVAAGHGPLGLTTAPLTGKIVADAMINDKIDDFLEQFSPSRFLN